MNVLYLGPDHDWAHGVLAKALGEPLESAASEAETVCHGPGSYYLIFLDLTGAVDGYWQPVIARLAHHGLKVVVVSPKPSWQEVRIAMFAGATYYIEKTIVVEKLVQEIAQVKTAGTPRRC